MMRSVGLPYDDTVAVLTSMHQKEGVIGPILRAELGLIVGLAMGVDTDQFGTFSREVDRKGSMLDAARAKITAGFEYAPFARVGLASEGSFGPHPAAPIVAVAREIVMLFDRERNLELIGYDATLKTNFGHTITSDIDSALTFAQRVGFPEHGLIVMGCLGDQPAPELMIDKEVTTALRLQTAVKNAILMCGSAFVETDMRAHRNPTRMRAIERATRDLVRRFHSRCPECDYPGFDVTERIAGLPCESCGEPTRIVKTEVLGCKACGHRLEGLVAATDYADPGQCDFCNP